MLPVQSFAASVLSQVILRQPSSPARTNFAWSVAVGPALARATTIELRDGVLLITPKDPRWTQEVERSTDTILARLRALLGSDVTRLQLIAPRTSDLGPRTSDIGHRND